MLASSAAPELVRTDRWRALLFAPVVSALAVFGGLAAGQIAAGNARWALAVPVVVMVPLAYWRWPAAAPLSLVAAALVIEEVRTRGPLAVIDRLPVFWNSVHALILLPIEGLVIVALVIWAMHSALQRSIVLPWTTTSRALLLLWALLLAGLGVGLSRGGHLHFALWELRPWILLSASYLLANALLTSRRMLGNLLWVLVCATGLKGVEGTYLFFAYVRREHPRPESILGHEESVFFGIFIVLALALWVFGIRGRLRVAATTLLPFVIVADLANSRRTAWGIVIAAVFVLFVAAWFGVPERRRLIGSVLCATIVGAAFYFPLYWNHGYGTISQPARALRSQVSPDSRDASSDQYRKLEDANLVLNIRMAGLTGRGFGTPIDYAIPIPDISKYDPFIAYIPHNGLLWIWMRLGVQGEIALWLLIGAAVLTAGSLVRSHDKFLVMFGTLVLCAVLAYVMQGYEDQGFASLRIAPVIGVLLGGAEAATRIAARTVLPDAPVTRARAYARRAVLAPGSA